MILALLRSMRPKQWLKNIFVFAALVFDVKLTEPYYLVQTLAGFALMCLGSGCIYLINDLADIEKDRQHPRKQHRPLASGALGVNTARAAAVVIGVISVALSFVLDVGFGTILSIYVAVQVAYSFWLKNVVIVDVMINAGGFLLRVAAGVALADAARFSPWLYVCMMLGALLISFGKRRHELTLLKDNANAHRESLQDYNLPLLDHAISIVTASTLLAYALYTFSAENLPAGNTMMLTIPFVFYGIFRYLYLLHVRGIGGAPEDIVLSDRPLQITIALWGLSVVAAMYLPTWLGLTAP